MPHRLFLVEDNPVIRRALTDTLEDIGVAEVVGWAESETPAIEAVQRTHWDVALVDLFLLRGSGLGIASAFACRAANQKLFVVSNYATQDIRSRCARLGVNDVFDKSTELDRLMDVLGRPFS